MPYQSAIPAYHEIYVRLAEQIRTGELAPGAKLLSEAKLSEHFGASRVTVRHALDLLVNDGLIEKYHGRGSFVTPSLQTQSGPLLEGILSNLVAQGAAIDVTDIDSAEVGASPAVATALKLAKGAPTLFLKRLRRHERKPVAYSLIWLPLALGRLVQDKKTPHGSLILHRLAQADVNPLSARHALDAVLAESDAANELGVSPGTPVLQMRGTVFGEAAAPLYHQVSTYHPKNYQYAIEIGEISSAEPWRAL